MQEPIGQNSLQWIAFGRFPKEFNGSNILKARTFYHNTNCADIRHRGISRHNQGIIRSLQVTIRAMERRILKLKYIIS